MTNTICLDERYSTTRLVTQEKPEILNNPEDKFETVLFLSEGEGRKGEGGLRTKGYFKKSFKDKPLISVITVVYNGEKYLEQTIQSVINQTYPNVEYIIIDGGSTDGTVDIIKKYEDKIDYWVSERDKGIYDAMNKGIVCSYCDEAYLYFLNADDFLMTNTIIEQVIQNSNNIEFVYGKINLIDKNFSVKSGEKVTKKSLSYKNICHHQSLFTKKPIFKKIGLFDLNYKIASDYNFIVQCFNHDCQKKFLDLTIASMRIGGISNTAYIRSLNEKLTIIKKNYSKLHFLRTIIYMYVYEIPRNLMRQILDNFGLLKYWRRIKNAKFS